MMSSQKSLSQTMRESLTNFARSINADTGDRPLLSFGVCTDLQWAEVDDRVVHGTASR